MAGWADVRRLALALPGTSEHVSWGHAHWRVRDRGFVWERPLGRTDREALGAGAPDGPIVAARVPDEGVRAALVAEQPDIYFTILHFAGFPAVLARLDRLPMPELEELVVEAWVDRAPARLRREYLAGRDRAGEVRD
ncbi:MmcQ/YjbR family DNA-binding protein [Nakamurella endophytica]|uniref:MmcQ/YjbR family DNA-binding protein n=1 Tax=Nakamurella endophytica TaxID=1748367 RepID=A0A917WDF5_9ACTN|nr:MmcQ/YjbR family DNA-binding protein [Nakamurella endophytica]GGL92515.1 hypothetical protein GCM10011594_10360 [Nakamurella endophytica]